MPGVALWWIWIGMGLAAWELALEGEEGGAE